MPKIYNYTTYQFPPKFAKPYIFTILVALQNMGQIDHFDVSQIDNFLAIHDIQSEETREIINNLFALAFYEEN